MDHQPFFFSENLKKLLKIDAAIAEVHATPFPGSLSYPSSLSLSPLGRVGENPGNEVEVHVDFSFKFSLSVFGM